MRELANAVRIRKFMAALGAATREDDVCYLTGGATAVLLGLRDTTVDVDVKFDHENDDALRAIPKIKEDLNVNVELASPADFIPLPKDWEHRSTSIVREGALSFRHFDLYSQALAKLERAHSRDLDDVKAMVQAGLIDPKRVMAYFEEIEPSLYRFPAIHPPSFRGRVEEFVEWAELKSDSD